MNCALLQISIQLVRRDSVVDSGWARRVCVVFGVNPNRKKERRRPCDDNKGKKNHLKYKKKNRMEIFACVMLTLRGCRLYAQLTHIFVSVVAQSISLTLYILTWRETL